jgi:hypothetical protein
MPNNQTRCCTPGSSSNSMAKWAKSTCAWRPAGVSKRTSNGATGGGHTLRRKSLIWVMPPA